MRSSLFAEDGLAEAVPVPLCQLEVLVVDCQATGARPRGHLLELGWARLGTTAMPAQARTIRLPDGVRLPPAVSRITGISESAMRQGLDADAAWRELSAQASTLPQQPAPTVIHFARFERPFLRSLAGGAPALDVRCTHEIARRLLPGLPRCSLRALAGYFGRGVGPLRRSADHVEATAFVWQALVRLLDANGVSTWASLGDWLAAPAGRPPARRAWPMPRDVRLALPDAPGLYRMLRTNGDVLYIGKASSLRTRVNSYFRKQRGVPERMLELLSQARGVSFEATATALEAALLEPDEIKRHRPPYNIALLDEDRRLWFASPDLGERSARPSARCPVGPFPSAEMLDEFASMARGDGAAVAWRHGIRDGAVVEAGFARFRAAHPELVRQDLDAGAQLLRLGARLWSEGRRDRDCELEGTPGHTLPLLAWTAGDVQAALEWLALRAALARRRAGWLTRMVEAAVVWSEPGAAGTRLIVVEQGEIAVRRSADPGASPPVPPGHARPAAARHDAFTIARFDRLRVLTTELKRLVAEGAPAALRFGPAPALTGARLARALSWV